MEEEIKHEVTEEEVKENNLEGTVGPGDSKDGIPVDDVTPAEPEALQVEDLPPAEFKPEPEA